ncbi:MAG: hypothetical protein U0K57_10170 [Lachnospiraceae bacterium]|nr:hypothetical protein [Lachnospiraceae bacterium]
MLEFRNVTIEKNRSILLEHFNLTVNDGAILGIFSNDVKVREALMQAAVGGRCPNKGEIILDEEQVYDHPADLLGKIGYMPSHYGFHERIRVDECYDAFLTLYHVVGRRRVNRVSQVLVALGLEKYEKSFIGELPEEELPFLALGRAILHQPQWLFLEEPFANMNLKDRTKMVNILLNLAELGVSLVITSQSYPDVNDIFSDIAVIEGSHLKTQGSLEEVVEEAINRSPIRMHLLSGLEEALSVLKEEPTVDRVIVDGMDVIFRFTGTDEDQARILSEMVKRGALIHHYSRDQLDLSDIFHLGVEEN